MKIKSYLKNTMIFLMDLWVKSDKEVSIDECDYEKDYMKIKFNSDNNLPLMTITIKSVFEENGKFYRQVF